jgi:hypothetical protein
MLDTAFYHSTIRNTIVSFGQIFSDVSIRKVDNNKVTNKIIKVPLSYGPKEKWLRRLEEQPTLQGNPEIILPRMSFEITNYQYDAGRKLGSVENYVRAVVNDKPVKLFTPVPYNVTLSFYIMTKTQEDTLQILEQILPHFSPAVTVSFDVIPEIKIRQDVPISLTGVSTQDTWDGQFEQRRSIITTLQFEAKISLYGPLVEGKPIKRAIVDNSLNSRGEKTSDAVYTAEVDPFSVKNKYEEHEIIDNWELNNE